MNDFDYDVKEKKRIARGAYAKKGGSRSKKCTLPGDYLTPAQKAKLSTTTVSVNLKAPMSVKDFKKLPTEIKREYLEWLRDTFHVTAAIVSSELFLRSRAYLYNRIQDTEPGLAGIFTQRGRSLTPDERYRWEAFLRGDPVEEEQEEESPEPPELPAVTTIAEIPPVLKAYCEHDVESARELIAELRPSHLTATYDGELYEADLNAIIHRLTKGRCCKSITIDITF